MDEELCNDDLLDAAEFLEEMRRVLDIIPGDCEWIMVPQRIMEFMDAGEAWYPEEVEPGVWEWRCA